jgi:hypothetical protein
VIAARSDREILEPRINDYGGCTLLLQKRRDCLSITALIMVTDLAAC